mmetsp:Transcript_8714/g.21519  ORF Transcript_8714/g.21519 Transcript_8714/m.21519 type:complete len:800 (-) Transcript_8714:221-2620(-)
MSSGENEQGAEDAWDPSPLPASQRRTVNGKNFAFAGTEGVDREEWWPWLDIFNSKEAETPDAQACSIVPRMPDESKWVHSGTIVTSIGSNIKIKQRMVVVTAMEICFDGSAGQLSERVLLLEIETMTMNPAGDEVVIQTFHDGVNNGKTYKLLCREAPEWFHRIGEVWEARIAYRDDYWRNFRNKVRRVYDSSTSQSVLCFVIALSFVNVCFVSQAHPEQGSTVEALTSALDLVTTVFFILDLCVNLYAHPPKEFVRNPWNLFDTCLISISIVWLLSKLGGGNSVLDTLRHVRAFRIFRVAGKVNELRKLVNALGKSVVPMLSGGASALLCLCVFCVLGTEFFKDVDPLGFGTFARTFYTLFLAMAFGSWNVELQFLEPESGTINFSVFFFTLFFVTFMLWISLQVVLAILLDNFVSSQEHDKAQDAKEELLKIVMEGGRGPGGLDALMQSFLDHYDTSRELSKGITRIFLWLDVDESGAVSYTEFYMGMKKLNVEPTIEISSLHWDILTHDYTLLDRNQGLGMANFHRLMRQQLHNYVQRNVHHVYRITNDSVATSWMLAAQRLSLYGAVPSLSEEGEAAFGQRVSSIDSEGAPMVARATFHKALGGSARSLGSMYDLGGLGGSRVSSSASIKRGSFRVDVDPVGSPGFQGSPDDKQRRSDDLLREVRFISQQMRMQRSDMDTIKEDLQELRVKVLSEKESVIITASPPTASAKLGFPSAPKRDGGTISLPGSFRIKRGRTVDAPESPPPPERHVLQPEVRRMSLISQSLEFRRSSTGMSDIRRSSLSRAPTWIHNRR